MGNALAIIGCVGVVIGVTALIRGRMGWARIRSRKVAAIATAGSVVALIVGAAIAAPARPALARTITAAAPAAMSTTFRSSPSPATSTQPTVRAVPSSPVSKPPVTQQPVTSTSTAQGSSTTSPAVRTAARTTAPVTAVAADVQQAGVRRAVSVLATLQIKGRAPMTGYSRAQFGSAWTDNNDDSLGRNGCDTRNDILRRDLTGVLFKQGSNNCAVLTGKLADPYTASTIAFTRSAATSTAVQIDHVVALGDAWQTGAQSLSARLRVDLANDPLELLAVAGPTNEAKGDGDAATWLPPNKAYRCAYVARQVAVKARYRLWVTPAEHAAIAATLTGCTTQTVPTEARALPTDTTSRAALPPTSAHPTPRTSAPPPVATPPAIPPPPQPAPVIPTVQAAVPAPSTPQPAATPTVQAGAAAGPTALCNDGSLSFAAHHQGACSHHGGVATFYR